MQTRAYFQYFNTTSLQLQQKLNIDHLTIWLANSDKLPASLTSHTKTEYAINLIQANTRLIQPTSLHVDSKNVSFILC